MFKANGKDFLTMVQKGLAKRKPEHILAWLVFYSEHFNDKNVVMSKWPFITFLLPVIVKEVTLTHFSGIKSP